MLQGKPKRYAVDRIEGDRVVLVPDAGGAAVEVPKARLRNAREGAVFSVPMQNGKMAWESATLDTAEEEARRKQMRQAVGKLRGTFTPGY